MNRLSLGRDSILHLNSSLTNQIRGSSQQQVSRDDSTSKTTTSDRILVIKITDSDDDDIDNTNDDIEFDTQSEKENENKLQCYSQESDTCEMKSEIDSFK